MQNYSFSVLWSDEDGEYVATSAEFPGLSGLAATPEEAIAELKDAIEVAVQAYLEDGEPVPSARHLNRYSGQLRLRLPKSLHAAAAARAEEEGVSLNTLLQTYVSQGLAADGALRVMRDLAASVVGEIHGMRGDAAPSFHVLAFQKAQYEAKRQYSMPSGAMGKAECVMRSDNFFARDPQRKSISRLSSSPMFFSTSERVLQ